MSLIGFVCGGLRALREMTIQAEEAKERAKANLDQIRRQADSGDLNSQQIDDATLCLEAISVQLKAKKDTDRRGKNA